MLVANLILSMDPAIRGFMDDRPSYLPPLAIGETIRGMTLGRVLRSKNPIYAEGTIVRALAGWEELSIMDGAALGLEVVPVSAGIPLEHYMGALGASAAVGVMGPSLALAGARLIWIPFTCTLSACVPKTAYFAGNPPVILIP